MYAIVLVSAVSLLALVIDLTTLASIISFGALVAFSAVNLSVIKHYFIDLRERSGASLLRHLILLESVSSSPSGCGPVCRG